jgi:hypothetical protein
MHSRSCDCEKEVLRPLSKEDIDRRIERIATELLAPAAESGAGERAAEDRLPRWISPAELVRRMRPFLVQN